MSYDEGDDRHSGQAYPPHVRGGASGGRGGAASYGLDDDFDEDEHAVAYAPNPAAERLRREKELARIRRRRRGLLITLAVVLVALLAAFLGVKGWLDGRRVTPAADYTGAGVADVVVRVNEGDAGTDIAATLLEHDVIASSGAFVGAAHGNTALTALQPGYYKVRTQVPAATAVDLLTDPANRVGAFVIAEGRQLDDITAVTGQVTEGIFTLIANASCVELDGEQTCVTAEELRDAASSASLDELGVPEWARESVGDVDDPVRRLEGLIAAGSWSVDPSSTPAQMLGDLITRSARQYEATGLLTSGQNNGLDPYEMLVAASLVERESKPEDFAKVARVILNRLDIDMMLQFDSTVNYALDRVEIGTSDADRARVTPWNTYAKTGLPLTPISSPSIAALKAVENPDEGDWIFFVTVDRQGTTVFTETIAEHNQQVEVARRNGVFDSGS